MNATTTAAPPDDLEPPIDSGDSLAQEPLRLMLARARVHNRTRHAWFRPMGFDPAPGLLRNVSTMLEKDAP